MTDDNWAYHGDHFVTHKRSESLRYKPETNRVLNINYTSKKKGEKSIPIMSLSSLQSFKYFTWTLCLLPNSQALGTRSFII